MHVQSYNEGTSPSLYYSKDGAHWDYMLLPAKRLRGSTIEELIKLCYSQNRVLITLDTEIFVPTDKRVMSSWQAQPKKLIQASKSIKTATKAPPVVWHEIDNKMVETLPCGIDSTRNSSWIIKKNKTTVHFRHSKKEINRVIDKTITMEKNPNKASSNYALQVGVYRNRFYANELISNLQKAGFRTYSKAYFSENSKITKIYVGVFPEKTQAQQALALLKKRFSNNKSLQSAFLVKAP